jgi:hypothetical protein
MATELSPHAGTQTTPNPYSFTIDTVPPSSPSAPQLAVFSKTGNPNGNYSKFSAPSFAGTASTADGTRTVYVYNFNNNSLWGGALVDSNGNYNVGTSSNPDGTYSLIAKSSDEALNVSIASVPISITIDTVVPTVSITTPTTGSSVSGTVNITASASDNAGGSGIWKVDFQVDGVTKTTVTSSTGPYTYAWDTSALATGSSHTLTAIAYDMAGNTTTSSTVTVTIGSGNGGGSGPSIGDFNSDGHVNAIDLSILLSHYGGTGTPTSGDCNNDGIVNAIDLSILLSHYGI